jgi:hypothetical protein
LRRREKIFWLFVGFALILGFISLIPTHYEICKEGAKTGEEACAPYRLVPFLIIEVGKILDALGVAVTALATIAIAWFTLSLRRSTDKLWDAGEKQRIHMEETAQTQLRAYVTAKSCRVRNLATEPEALIELENGGQTPAFGLTFFGTFLSDPDKQLKPPRLMSSGTVGAGRKINLSVWALFPVPTEDVEAISAGRLMFFVRGRAKYKDVFGVEHTTNIKFARGELYGALPAAGTLAMCEDGNESD